MSTKGHCACRGWRSVLGCLGPLDPRIYNEAYLHTQPPDPRLDGEGGPASLPCPHLSTCGLPLSHLDCIPSHKHAGRGCPTQLGTLPAQRAARDVSSPVSPCPHPPQPCLRGSHAPLRAFDGAVSPAITQLPPSFRPVPKAGPQPPGLPSPAPPEEGRNPLFCPSESGSGICRMHR